MVKCMYLHPGSGLNMMDKVSKFSTLHNLGFDKPRENSPGVSKDYYGIFKNGFIFHELLSVK